MAAVPKNKRSKAKRNTKRNSFKLKVLSIVECPRCRAKKIAHHVCQACGYYDNKEIIKLENKSKEKSSGKTKETAQTGKGNILKRKSRQNLNQGRGEVKVSNADKDKLPEEAQDNNINKAANS